MTSIYIALDIETTGLKADSDSILEIGAVQFSGPTIQKTFHTLINPQRDIPYSIQQLTGITPDEIDHAPPISKVVPELREFVADYPIVGHNIQFDLAFLRRHGIGSQNPAIDTFELASILLPYANRYSLSALTAHLDVELPHEEQAHRALSDAKTSHRLFEALLDQARQLDPHIINEIARLTDHADGRWALARVFQALRDEKLTFYGDPAPPIREAKQYAKPLKPKETAQPLAVDTLREILSTGGLFDQALTEFEHRPQQVEMLAQIAQTYNEEKHLIIEAGTGTGKSLAYLLPSIHWAVSNQQRVVISTNTINLQDQLLRQDIPTLRKILTLPFRAVALKGRGNYVCPKRVLMFQAKGRHTPLELRLLSKLLVWLPQTDTGDREELFMPDRDEQRLWWQVASDGQTCTARTCGIETCFYARARREAESAHIIVVNHALLLADIGVEGNVIPEYSHLVIDEAHHLEDNITQQLSFSADRRTLELQLSELSQANRDKTAYRGLIDNVESRCLPVAPEKAKPVLREVADNCHRTVGEARQAGRRLFQAVESFAEEFARSGQYGQKISLTEETRNRPTWSNVEFAWEQTGQAMAEAGKYLSRLHTLVGELENYDVPDWEDLLAEISLHRQRFEQTLKHLHLIIAEPVNEQVCWIEQKANDDNTSLYSAPLHVGSLFHDFLLKTKQSIILTSATMRTNDSFEYIQERLHLWEVKQAAVGSPFDYHRNTLLYIPTNMPLPHTHNYLNALSRSIIALATEIGGRTLVLFTAYSQLKQVAQLIRSPLSDVGIAVYQQGDGTSRRQLIENFKSADKAILLGTRSFWEGVDIPGPALSCVVITKIPFAVPTDPIMAARSQTFDNPFYQFSIPVAILMFRQGFGRLIRTKTDRGVVVIMDNRVISKRYGQAFIDSLPEVTEERGSLAQLPMAAYQWLEESTN